MFAANPFAGLAGSLPPNFMKTFLVLMVLAVAVGTIVDILHKGSARYFFVNWRKSRGRGRELGAGDMLAIAAQTAVVDVLASGEFCNVRRRIAHLLGMYGFVFYIVATAVMVFAYPTSAEAGIWP